MKVTPEKAAELRKLYHRRLGSGEHCAMRRALEEWDAIETSVDAPIRPPHGIGERGRPYDRPELMKKVYLIVWEATKDLTQSEAISLLECAKLDIILNEKIMILDGKPGTTAP